MPSSSFLQRLKERKLVQWALAYLAGAFVVFQGVEVLAEPWSISPGVQRAIHILLLVGLCVTLVLAWYHGEKGRQRVSGPELLIVAALLVIGGGVMMMLGGEVEDGAPADSLPTVVVEDNRPSIAVLPCANWSTDPADAYLADGIHDEILVRLQKISSLRSIGRTSVVRFREDPPPVHEIAQLLSVGFIGECSVRKYSDQAQIRLTFQLMDASGTQLWAETYDRNLTTENIYEMEDSVASLVAFSVQAEILPDERERIQHVHTDNLSAYQANLLGRHYLDQLATLDDAIRFFDLALEEDSTFAPAHAGLAQAYDFRASTGGMDPIEGWRLVEREAQAALRIDSTLAEAWAMLGDARMITWDWTGAEEAFQRAIQLRPGYGTAHQFYSILLIAQGRVQEALAEAQIGVDVSPTDPSTHTGYAVRLLIARRYEESLEWFDQAGRLGPAGPVHLSWLMWAYSYAGMPDRAFETLQRLRAVAPDSAWVWSGNAFLHAGTGDSAAARTDLQKLDDLSETQYVDPYNLWLAYAALGEKDIAFAWLERGIEHRSWGTLYLGAGQVADPLRDDPRYQTSLDRIGLGHLRARFDSLASVAPSARSPR